MSDTLRTLDAVSRPKPVELCCPECDSDIVLESGVYRCPVCLSEFASLAELAVREVPRA